ncbi:hypothetical protein KCG48_10380 [Proteiniclasticum sp. BAD-10]|uniref:Uncharacterized protein n=1 Tax=Proteiniclasticum sediminis TaxID=2804028 RepID=A0A941CT02_9CLOT|nr:hypothetical protein [Proteiniclasticum sediminis]MBR0576738.1 hypothetical protein [Proteiniclasticum sediminis]
MINIKLTEKEYRDLIGCLATARGFYFDELERCQKFISENPKSILASTVEYWKDCKSTSEDLLEIIPKRKGEFK